jgi:hypothetical protein
MFVRCHACSQVKGQHFWRLKHNTGYTQKNGAVSIVFTFETAPFFCVCPVLFALHWTKVCGPQLVANWNNSECWNAWHHVKWCQWSSGVDCQIKLCKTCMVKRKTGASNSLILQVAVHPPHSAILIPTVLPILYGPSSNQISPCISGFTKTLIWISYVCDICPNQFF